MKKLEPIPEEIRRELAVQLSQVRETFLTVTHTLEGRAGLQGLVHTVQHQLKWAAAHVQAAVLALSSEQGMPKVEQPRAPLPSRRLEGEDDGGGRSAWPSMEASQSDNGIDFAEGLCGHTQSISIAEILGFIAGLRKSGTLAVHGATEDFLIELKDGNVVYAQGDNPPAGLLLGEILVTQGSITQVELDGFLLENAIREEVLGGALLRSGRITTEVLRIALAYQIQHLFHRVVSEQDGYFQFEENVTRIRSDDILLNVQMLLLESARTQDEREAGRGD